jgi:hypothetical protein
MWRRRKSADTVVPEFPAELLEEARSKPRGWVYAIDPGFAPDGATGAIPPEGIIGAWKIGDDGRPTGEYRANERSGGPPSSAGLCCQRR